MIRLEPFGPADFKELIDWVTDEELLMNWSGSLFSFPLTPRSLDWYIRDSNMANSSDAFIYKAVDDATGKSIGHISLGGISWKNRSSRITRVLIGNTAERGKGYCCGIVKAALKIGFEELNLHRIALGLYDDNTAALKCYEKAGLKVEGISRDILWYNGRWRSMIEMAMLEDEWKEIKDK